jgi:hypothetical protein
MEALRRLILYKCRVAAMDGSEIPVKISKEELKRRNTWNQQCKTWLEEWGVREESYPTDVKELKHTYKNITGKENGGNMPRENCWHVFRQRQSMRVCH